MYIWSRGRFRPLVQSRPASQVSGLGACVVPASVLVRHLHCTTTDLAAISNVVGKTMLSDDVRSAITKAVERAVQLLLGAADPLTLPRPTSFGPALKLRQSFLDAFGVLPGFVPTWRPKGQKWDRGAVVRERLRCAARILSNGSIRYRCWGPLDCKDLAPWRPTHFAMVQSGKLRICLGQAFWSSFRDGKADDLAATLLHETLHIYFDTIGDTRERGPFGFAACYERFVSLMNGLPLSQFVLDNCASGLPRGDFPVPPRVPSIAEARLISWPHRVRPHHHPIRRLPISRLPSRRYSLGEPSPATFSPEFRVMTSPVFRTIPITFEKLTPPKSQGDPYLLETQKPFVDIASLRQLLRKLTVGMPPETVEFSVGQALLDTSVFQKDPSSSTNFQIPLVHSLAYPADPTNPDNLAPSKTPFPVVVIAHGQHESYFFAPRLDASGKLIKRTVSGAKFPRIEFGTLTNEVLSFLGFKYLQLELAKRGIVSVSINSNPANIFDDSALLKLRSDLILAHLELLDGKNKDSRSAFFQKLDLNRVGLVGHSRGGDAVVKAFHDNKGRFGIKAAVSLAPLDQTGLLEESKRLRLTSPDLHYLVVYGAHDGDTGNWSCSAPLGTGFRHYDRATCPRAMLFVHGATHNRFNTAWTDDERRVKNEIAASKPGINRILTRNEHEELAKEYIGGWFRKVLNGETGLDDLFNGTRVVSVASGLLTVATQWSFGTAVKVIDDFEGSKASENRLRGKSISQPAKVIIKTSLGRVANQLPHQTKGLVAGRIAKGISTFSTEIPDTVDVKTRQRNRDFKQFDLFTFRMTKLWDLGDVLNKKVLTLPEFQVRMKDAAGRSATISHVDIYAANPNAFKPPYNRIDWGDACKAGGPARAAIATTLTPLETLSVPLTLFSKANAKIDLTNVRFVEFDFTSVNQPEIVLDDLQLVKR